MQTQITANGGDISALQALIAANDAAISSLQSAVLAVENGLIALDADLQGQIDGNLTLINALQAEIDDINTLLAFKQDLVNGTCPGGNAIAAVNSDGSVVCTPTGGGGSGTLQKTHVWSQSLYTYSGQDRYTNYAYCPSGYTISGSGFYGTYRVNFYRSRADAYPNGAYARAYNAGPYNTYIYARADCMRIVP